MMAEHEVHLSLSEDVQRELGKSLVLFNLVEGLVDEVISALLTANGRGLKGPVAEVLLAELSLKQKLGQADSLFRWSSDQFAANPDEPLVTGMNPTGSQILEQWTQIRKLICVAEDERNRLVHSRWIDSGHQIEVTVHEKRSDGSGVATLVIGTGTADSSQSDDDHVAVRVKTTAKQGKGLVQRHEPLTLSEVKAIGVHFSLVLLVLGMFRGYFYRQSPEDLYETINEYLANI